MKVMIFSHAHPTFSKGGAELSAYYLWQEINRLPDHEAWFVGRADHSVMHQFSSLSGIGEREYLISGSSAVADFATTILLSADSALAQLLRKIEPDVVHFHHYVNLGVELIRLVRQVCPRTRIVMTLHEYLAICMNSGQMVKTSGRLCYQSSPRECHQCFPEISTQNFFLREMYIKSFFDLVDVFVSPSEFLRQRYVQWGISPDRIEVIENGIPQADPVPPRAIEENGVRNRFAYFGQITQFKGVDLILEAFSQLPSQLQARVRLDVFGSGLESQPKPYRKKVNRLLRNLGSMVRLHGAYEPHEMPQLMKSVDWVVMGSLWWENSPLVIQEAFCYGRPIITPDIGGMAEKVRPGLGGLNYRAMDSVSLSEVVGRVVQEQGLFDELLASRPAFMPVGHFTELLLARYRRLCEGS